MSSPSGPTTAIAIRQLLFLASLYAAAATSRAWALLRGVPYSGDGVVAGGVCAVGCAAAEAASQTLAPTVRLVKATDRNMGIPLGWRRWPRRHDVVRKFSQQMLATR